ncbi:MAG: PIN domain-containing protein [Dehalococcoidia bacterium]
MILDTNALSAWAKRDADLLPVLLAGLSLEIPVVVVGEYLFGLTQSTRGVALRDWLFEVVQEVVVLPVTLATAEAYAIVRAELEQKGRPIPANDLWIAALAVQHQVPVLSRDAHFDVVDGVERIAW